MKTLTKTNAPHDKTTEMGALQAKTGWENEIRNAIRSVKLLCKTLEIEIPDDVTDPSLKNFPVFVPHPFLQRIEKGNPLDPLLMQVLPVEEEFQKVPGFSNDPVGDLEFSQSPGVIHKYKGRALLITNGVCAVHCRYCFRREFPYSDAPKSMFDWSESLQQIAADQSIEEIILSGGDPLMLVNRKLRELIAAIESIPHVRRLRIHSRLPIMIPSRIDQEFCGLLSDSRLEKVFVVHVNHANEIDTAVGDSIERLISAGAMVLNQSVLLCGINDTAKSLISLSKKLLQVRVIPYYLNQLDRVNGAAHFEVDIESGKRLIAAMRENLPGYAVPRYVHRRKIKRQQDGDLLTQLDFMSILNEG